MIRFRPISFTFCCCIILHAAGQQVSLFDDQDPVDITISGNIKELFRDRQGEPQYFDAALSYQLDKEIKKDIPIRIRTRGNFRRIKSNCHYPPLLINFSKESVVNTVFKEQNKVKLVMPCRGEEYVLSEYLVYRLYNIVTPKSFKARLVRVSFQDAALKEKDSGPFMGILIEEEEQMTARNNMVSIDRKLLLPEQTQQDDFLLMAVFQYLIGNTDWSIQYRQNIKLIAPDSLTLPSPVPYDFDHAGIVGAPYAFPTPELELSSIRERRYRGYCIKDVSAFTPVIQTYNELKESLYAVYSTNNLIDEKYKRWVLSYLDDFYHTINHPKKFADAFQYPCRNERSANVVIMGLKN